MVIQKQATPCLCTWRKVNPSHHRTKWDSRLAHQTKVVVCAAWIGRALRGWCWSLILWLWKKWMALIYVWPFKSACLPDSANRYGSKIKLYYCTFYIILLLSIYSLIKIHQTGAVLSMQGNFMLSNGLEYLKTLGSSVPDDRVINTALISETCVWWNWLYLLWLIWETWSPGRVKIEALLLTLNYVWYDNRWAPQYILVQWAEIMLKQGI